jgi:hypothetical protein
MSDTEKKPGKICPVCKAGKHDACTGCECECRCTWKGCKSAAVHPQVATDGDRWANLCDEHNAQLEAAITKTEPEALLQCWTLAGGGAEKMAARVAGTGMAGTGVATPQSLDSNGPTQPVVAGGTRPVHPNNPQSPRRITAAQRRAQVMEYKLLGASLRQIAEKLGISFKRVHQIVCEELTAMSEQTRMTTEQYRQQHLLELDALKMGIMQQARTGDVFAIDRVIRIQQQYERILPGLAIPTKVAAGIGGLDEGGNPSGGRRSRS